MREAIKRSNPVADDREQRDQQDVGRSTRSQELAPSPAMFDDEPQWEAIEQETEEVEAEDPATIAALDLSEDDEALAAGDEDLRSLSMTMPSTVAHVAAVGSAHGRHDAPYERKVKKATGHDAKQDRYNDRDVHSNRVAKHRGKDGKLHANPDQIGRPGLRVHGKDEFHLRGEYAYRYQIVNGSKAVAVDKIWEKELQHGQDKEGQRLALNPSAPRRLMIDGVGVWCVMSWAGAQSAAWIAIKDLEGKFADIKGAASKLSKRWNPKDAGKSKRDHATEMKFRSVGDPLVTTDSADQGHYIVPGQKGKNGNEVGDYLVKDVLRRAQPGVTGKAASESKRLEHHNKDAPLTLPNGMRGLVSIVGNLPHDRTPPTAIDTAQPGVDSFFVPKGKTFRREISLYKRHKKKSTLRQTWVYGYVGRDQGTRKVADKNRRGWVPLRTLVRP